MTETEKKVRETGTLVVKCVVGSQAFGLATPTSDIDIRGVYVLPYKEWLRREPALQIADEKNNEVYWEVTKFIKELAKFNAQALDLLYSPDHCIIEGKVFLEKLRGKIPFQAVAEAFRGICPRADLQGQGPQQEGFQPEAARTPEPPRILLGP